MTDFDLPEDPIEDVLIESPLHKVMLAFHMPAGWPTWRVAVLALVLAALAALPWFFLTDIRTALIVFGAQLAFMVGDTAVLMLLPKNHISFGPWKAQIFSLAVPRMLATIVLSLTHWGLGAVGAVALTGGIQALGTILLLWGAVVEPQRLHLSEYLMFTDRLPPDVPPIKILHISDLHVERLTKREEAVLELAAETQPDIILITGDYVNLSYNQDPVTLAQVRSLLSQLDAPHGVYATLGSPPVDLRETVVPIFDGLPIHLMRHSWTMVDLDEKRQLALIGMDCTHHLPTDQARFENLMVSAPNSAPQILLYHSPELMPQAVTQGIDLYLCGHTHGGQVRLPFIGPVLTSSQLGRAYVMGLYRNGRTHLYVSRGVGMEGLSAPRVRFLAPPEITLITLMPVNQI